MTQSQREHVAAWVTALRSGEYRQGIGVLHYLDGGLFCCLGVACDLHRKATGGAWDALERNEDFIVRSRLGAGYLGQQFKLPREVSEWLGCDSDPILINGGRVLRATAWNDGAEKTFGEIADLIEKNLLAGDARDPAV